MENKRLITGVFELAVRQFQQALFRGRGLYQITGRPREKATPRYAVFRDRNKYTGAMLRAIRAERGCGRPPAVLAKRRTKL